MPGARKADRGDSLTSGTDLEIFRPVAVKAIFADINQTCTRLGIRFDVFTNELDLFNSGQVEAVLKALHHAGLTFEQDGAVFLRGEPLGLPQDAVPVRSGPDRQLT